VKNVERPMECQKYARLLIFVVLSGLLLRFYRLDFNSLWLDEAVDHNIAQKSFFGIWKYIYSGGEVHPHPPFFYWLEHIMLYLGDSEFILRFIPAVAGVLTIPIFYLIGIEFKDRNTGLLLATLLAFSPFHVYYSQEARSYALSLFFFSIAFLFYLKILRSNNVRDWMLFGAFSSITFWTHYYAFVPIGLLYIYSLIINLRRIRENIKNIRCIGISIFVFFLLSLPILLKSIGVFFSRTSSAPTWGMNGVSIITQTLISFSGYNENVVGIFLLLFYIGLVLTIFRDTNKSLLLAYMLFFSFLISYVLTTKMPMMPRYLIYLLPIFYLGMASSYEGFNRIVKDGKLVYFLMIFIIITSLPHFSSYYSNFQKEDWKGFSKNLQKMTYEDDVIVVLPGYITQPLDYYYSNKSDLTYEYEAYNSLELQQIYSINKGRRIFYVVTGDIKAANPEGDAIQWLQNNTEFLEKHTNIFLFKSGGH
jgi:mannosyltransferase